MEFETVIGIEIHAQLLTNTKIFCACQSTFGAQSNTRGCPVCLGLPGALPVLNRRVVELAVRMGLACQCSIMPQSIFARKNYFYPDLPKGYQISQYELPICQGGSVTIECDGVTKKISLTRIHLEEDAGKLIHDQDIDSLFDVNRCGTPLIEIVSEPDLHSSAETYAFLTSLKQTLEYLQISDCNMEEGSLRCDANISLRPQGTVKLGTKTELKNLNSFRGVERALEYEIKRQRYELECGRTIIQQTYLWNDKTGQTVAMRSKEDAHDYRYFPDPDLTPVIVTQAQIDAITAALPELPSAKRSRFIAHYHITPYMAEVLCTTRSIADYFETVCATCTDRTLAANWVMGEVLRLTKESNLNLADLKITPVRLAALLNLISNQTISAAAAKKVFDLVETRDLEPAVIVETEGLKQLSDSGELEKLLVDILTKNPKEVERYKAGDTKLAAFFIGQVMKLTRGKGNPVEITKLLAKHLG